MKKWLAYLVTFVLLVQPIFGGLALSEESEEQAVEIVAEQEAVQEEEPVQEPTEVCPEEAPEAPVEEPVQEEPAEDAAAEPTEEPTVEPAEEPTEEPTVEPAEEPTAEPMEEPTVEPMVEPTVEPMVEPTAESTEEPVEQPTAEPAEEPAATPAVEPSEVPGPTPEQTPEAPFAFGYARLKKGTAVFASPSEQEPMGKLEADGVVYAQRAADWGEDWYQITFDTEALRLEKRDVSAGYIRTASLEALSEAETQDCLARMGEDSGTREQSGIPIPCIAFAWAREDHAEPTPDPRPEATAEPEAEPTLYVRVEQTEFNGAPALEAVVQYDGEGSWSYTWQRFDKTTSGQPQDALQNDESGWDEIEGADKAVLPVFDLYGEAYAGYAYRCVVATDSATAVSEVYEFSETIDETIVEDGTPKTAQELADCFGVSVEELAELLEISVEQLEAMTEAEIREIYNILNSAALFVTGPYDNLINSTYAACLKRNGKSFSGWCGQYVRYQLEQLGINYVASPNNFNGNQVYYSLTGNAKTSTGYVQKKYPGNSCLYDIVKDYGSKVENIVVSWKHQSGYTDSNPGYGHTNFIYGIVNGMVYFSESYDGWQCKEGAPQALSISAFMSRYNGNNGNAIGAVLFTKNPDHLSIEINKRTQPGNTILKGAKCELDGTVQATSYIRSLVGRVYSGSTVVLGPSTAPYTNNYYSVEIAGSHLNRELDFSALQAGKYVYEVIVNCDKGSQTFRYDFEVVGPTASTLQFKNVTYPKIFVMNSAGWTLTTGTLSSNVKLATIRTQIITANGSVISDSGTLSITGYDYEIKTLDNGYNHSNDNGVRFSKIKTAGKYEWRLTATDSSGRILALSMPFTAVSSGSTSLGSSEKSFTVAVTSVSLNYSALSLKVGQSSTIAARIYPENATDQSLSWTSSDTSVATVSNGTVTAVGAGVATISCRTNDGGYLATCTVTVQQPVEVYNFSASLSIASSGAVVAAFTVKTSTSATSLKLCSESGAVVKTFTSGYSDANGVRTWRVSYTFANDGARQLSFIASGNGVDSPAYKYSITLTGVQVKSAKFNASTVNTGAAAQATIVTDSGAKYLHMYSENGTLIKTWPASGYSNGKGAWSVSYAFTNPGIRTMTFKASLDGQNPKAGKTAKITVNTSTAVTWAVSSHQSITAMNTMTFTVKTTTDAYYLKMYSENGGLVKTWTASGNSTVSGSTRTWTLPYAFTNAGDRTVTFKASANGATMSAGRSVSVKILALPAVTSAYSSHDTITAKNTLTFTVKTPANGYLLSLYAEGGNIVKTWNTSYSTVSGNVRTWKVPYTFVGAGNRVVTLKVSADGKNYGVGKQVKVNVFALPAVSNAYYTPSTVSRGETTTIVAYAPSNGYMLHMFLEDGKLYRTWNASQYATKSGSGYVYRIPYTFGSAGDRRITFKASADGKNYGTGKTVNITVK